MQLYTALDIVMHMNMTCHYLFNGPILRIELPYTLLGKQREMYSEICGNILCNVVAIIL